MAIQRIIKRNSLIDPNDIIEVANFASLPITGIAERIYITKDNDTPYYWDGSLYKPLGIKDHASLSNIGINTHSQIDTHIADANNPHQVTKTQVGLSNVDNVQQIPLSQKGAINGVAELDAQGFVKNTQLPSYVDDVLEYANLASFPVTGESGKIYIAIDTNITYRWSGTVYAPIGSDLALGETSATAYRGDRGKIAYDHSQVTHDKTFVGLSNVDNTSDVNKPVSIAQQTALNLKENSANKQNSLATDGTGTKFPTVDAVNVGLGLKITAPTPTPTSGDVLKWNGSQWVSGTNTPVVGGASKFYLDPITALADNLTLQPSPSISTEVMNAKTVSSSLGVVFFERFISAPLGRSSIPAGTWHFDNYVSNTNSAGLNKVHIRVNKRVAKLGITGTFTGTGPTRTFTVTGGAPFAAGDANTSRLLAGLIETPTQTAWISGFTSSTVVTVTLTDAGFVNVANVNLTAIYYLLFSVETANITSAIPTLYDIHSIQPTFTIGDTDRIVAAYFATTDGTPSRTMSLYYGGNTNYTHIETPISTLHNDLAGLNDGDHKHLTAVEKTDLGIAKVVANATIVGATKTKITYDAKGLVTAGGDAGIADITGLQGALDTKQASLVSGTNIKTIEGQTLLGVGNIDLSKTDVGLSNVDNTADSTKPVSTAQQTALNLKEDKTNKNIANGYVGLDANLKINPSHLPALAVTDTFVVASQVAMLTLVAETGDVAVRTDLNKSFILRGTNSTLLADWQELLTPTDAVQSVFGRSGAVSAQANDYNADQILETATRVFVTPTEKTVITHANRSALDLVSGTNTGDQTSIVGITGTKAQFNTAVTDGDIMYVGDAPTTHNHDWSTITTGKPTTIAGYGITDYNSLGDVRWLGINDKAADSNLLDGLDSTAFSLSGHTHSYLPLTGGTVNGNVIISGAGSGVLEVISGTDGSNGLIMKFPSGTTNDSASILFKGNDGVYNIDYASIRAGVQSWSSDNGYLGFRTALSATLSEKMRLTAEGNLGVGYTTGTEITNNRLAVNGSGFFSGILSASNLSGTNTGDQDLSTYTNQGNTFNGVNQLVQLDGTGKLPAIDGSQLTNLPSSGGLTTTILVGNTSNPPNAFALVGYLYILTVGTQIVTLPSTPTIGDRIGIANRTDVLTCVIARNGSNIQGLAEDMTVDTLNIGFELVYTNATQGWVLQ